MFRDAEFSGKTIKSTRRNTLEVGTVASYQGKGADFDQEILCWGFPGEGECSVSRPL